MENKKNESARLENFSFQFLLLGLVFTLYISYSFIEYKSYYSVEKPKEATINYDDSFFENTIVTVREKPKLKVAHTPPPKVLIEVIPTVEDLPDFIEKEEKKEEPEKTKENTIEPKENDFLDGIIVDTEPETITETLPFILLESAPVFPGCEKKAKTAQKKCFEKNIHKFINKKFDNSLGNELGLSEGRKRIHVAFTINSEGKIIDIMSRAPHPRLEKEAERIIKLLPEMTPGKQGNKPVNVKYSVPIVFEVRY